MAFLQLVQAELEEAKFDAVLLKRFEASLKTFIHIPAVAMVLGSAFEPGRTSLDVQTLVKEWEKLDPPTLNTDFDWGFIAKSYRREVRDILKADEELAAIFTRHLQEQTAESLQELAGAPTGFE